jgi:hypothetical protein
MRNYCADRDDLKMDKSIDQCKKCSEQEPILSAPSFSKI